MSATGDLDGILAELTAIKRLVVIALLKQGLSQKAIAAALNVNQSSISRMFPQGLGE